MDENHIVLLPRSGTDSEYLLAMMEWLRLSELVQPGAVPSLNMPLVRNLKVPITASAKQQDLGGALGGLRILARSLGKEAMAARTLRATTLDQLLSGAVEVPAKYDVMLEAV